MKKITLCFALVFTVCTVRGNDSQKPLVVHEWGTFTSLQDEQGNAIGGINTDDEPVPFFVHRLGYNLIAPQRDLTREASINMSESKIGPMTYHCDTDVLVRLETPVIYFYPPAGWKPQPVDVHVAFPGGWLSEFYPNATTVAPGFVPSRAGPLGHLSRDKVGELSWTGLVVGGHGVVMDTDSKVWLAPRMVKSAQLGATSGESEKFLFYRGVGNVEASLRVARNTGGDLQVSDNAAANMPGAPLINAAWLVDVRADGACAFKSLGPVQPSPGVRVTMPGAFAEAAYSAANMPALRGEMRAALVNEGLFADEADALLNTWEVSYFKNPGLRFFYLCPRVQIEAALPLQISAPASISRVMIGRIEIVTPAQRALLKQIADGPGWTIRNATLNQDYSDLGRFRNALLLDEQKLRPTAALNDFINRNDLGAYGTPRRTAAIGLEKSTLAFLAAFAALFTFKFFKKPA